MQHRDSDAHDLQNRALECFYAADDGLRLFYRDYPGEAATPVLCLPGLTRNSRDFCELAAALSPRYRVLTPDFRGTGLSAWDPVWQNYQHETYVRDILALLEHADIERVVLLGTSLGGIVGMMLGAPAPHRLAGLILNDVGPEAAPGTVMRIAQYVGRSSPVRTWDEAAQQARKMYGSVLPDYTPEDWLRYARRSYRDSGAGVPVFDMDPKIGDAMRLTLSAGSVPDFWDAWQALVSIPILIFRGQVSDVLSEATVSRMLHDARDAQAVRVPNRGHTPTLDESECVVAVQSFMARFT